MIEHGNLKSEKEKQNKEAFANEVAAIVKRLEVMMDYLNGPIESLCVCKLTGKKSLMTISLTEITEEQLQAKYLAMRERQKETDATIYSDKAFYDRSGVQK